MPPNQPKPINPFNIVLLVVGVLFVVTACGYSVLTVKASHPFEASEATASGEWLLNLLDQYGFAALMTELVILAFTAFAAMGTDEYWTRRASAKSGADPPEAI